VHNGVIRAKMSSRRLCHPAEGRDPSMVVPVTQMGCIIWDSSVDPDLRRDDGVTGGMTALPAG